MASRAMSRTKEKLAEVMERRRELCAEFESAPDDSSADAVALVMADRSQVSAQACEPGNIAPARRHRNDVELQSWLRRMKGRCQVLESTPKPTQADTMWSDVCVQTGGQVLESTPSDHIADACWGVAAPGRPNSSEQILENQPAMTTADARHEGRTSGGRGARGGEARRGAETWRSRVRSGQPLPHNLRAHLWAEQLPMKRARLADEPSAEAAVPALLALLRASAEACGGGGDLAGGGACPFTAAPADVLATAFAEHCLPWLAAQTVFSWLVQLLLYHCPAVVAKLAAVVPDVASSLDVACGGPTGLVQRLLTPGEGGFAAVLLLCDRLVLEANEMLLLFVVVVLFEDGMTSEAALLLDGTFEQLVESIRVDVLRSVGLRSALEISQCLDRACAMYEATPLSLVSRLSAGVSPGGDGFEEGGVATVAAHEVLTHVFETPACSWRLVIVDVRKEVDGAALPVCMRLTCHQDREELLRNLPQESAIHLCLLADGPPVPGDEAFRLSKLLVGPPTFRKHLSVAEGGWPGVAGLALSLGLELLPLEVEGGDSEEPREVPQRSILAGATGTAAAAGLGVARRVMAGLGLAEPRADVVLEVPA